jgi:plasmid stability protein
VRGYVSEERGGAGRVVCAVAGVTVRMDLRLPDGLHARLRDRAAGERRSAHAQALLILEAGLGGEGEIAAVPDAEIGSAIPGGPSAATEVTRPSGVAAPSPPSPDPLRNAPARVNAPSEFKPDPKPGAKR